jgi:hypothetical protein
MRVSDAIVAERTEMMEIGRICFVMKGRIVFHKGRIFKIGRIRRGEQNLGPMARAILAGERHRPELVRRVAQANAPALVVFILVPFKLLLTC